MSEKPTPESYWVIQGRFLAGRFPASTNDDETVTRQSLTACLNARFDTFLDLTCEGELPPYQSILYEEASLSNQNVLYRRFSVPDKCVPAPEKMSEILDAIDTALDAGHKIYLHCWGGIGRTGTVVGCWLARHGLTGEEALRRLNELYQTAGQSTFFPYSPETEEQREFILNWTEGKK